MAWAIAMVRRRTKTTARMHALGIETGADLRRQTLDLLQRNFGKAGSWYYEIARGQDDRPVQPDRERKSSGSETTFSEDLTDPTQIEAGVIAMADDVWESGRMRPNGHRENQMGRLSDFHPQPVDEDDDPNAGEATSAGSRSDPIGIPTTQRHSARRRNDFELSSATRQRSSGASSFVRRAPDYRRVPALVARHLFPGCGFDDTPGRSALTLRHCPPASQVAAFIRMENSGHDTAAPNRGN